jgi:hypothetical protein
MMQMIILAGKLIPGFDDFFIAFDSIYVPFFVAVQILYALTLQAISVIDP